MNGIIGRESDKSVFKVEEFSRQEHEYRLYLSNSNWDSFIGAKDAQRR